MGLRPIMSELSHLKKARSQILRKIIPRDISPECCQLIEPDKMSLLTRRLVNPQMTNVYNRHVKIRKRNPVLTTSQAYARSSAAVAEKLLDFVSQSSKSGIRFLHNLVHALAAQVVRIRDLTKRHSLAAHLKNFGISVRVARGPWLQRTPLPARKAGEDFHLFCRKKTLLLALTDVADPRANSHLFAVDNFHMNCRDSGVTSALGVLSQSGCVQVESGFVVHEAS